MAKKSMNELKKRAMLAKQRMKMGYWEQMLRDREKMIGEVGSTCEAKKFVSDLQRDKYNREFNVTVCKTTQDEKLYEKVCNILESDEIVINPISRLIDSEEYDNMDNEAKQRYILELSSKFRELKDRYYREQVSKSS